ncbi:MAG: hypothetical protein OEV28_04180 [Nitrospirota bacterium]|nr:hypothetical protein [Nitrospirota bacterium]
MKRVCLLMFFALIVSTIIGCAKTRYYAPVLMTRDSADAKKYNPVISNAINIPQNDKQVAVIAIEKIFPGFLHRNLGDNSSNREKANAYKNKDLWVVMEAEGLVGNDIFESKVEKKAVFSHVILNASSYDALEAKIEKIPIETNKTHRIRIKIYAIDKFLIKKALYQAKDKSIGKWLYDSVLGLTDALNNALFKEITQTLATATDQSSNVEQFLIAAGSNLEFYGIFDIVPLASNSATKIDIALYDKLKSEYDQELEGKTSSTTNVAPIPLNKTAYDAGYLDLKKQGVVLQDTYSDLKDLDLIKKAYVKLSITIKNRTDADLPIF